MFNFTRIRVLVLTCLMALMVACSNDTPVLEDLDGEKYSLSELDGKWLVINYWASWCKPCYKEVPELNRFYQTHSEQAILLGVSFDQVTPEELPAIIEHMEIEFPTLRSDPTQALGIEQLPGLPATLIFSPQGKLVKSLYGPQTEVDLVAAMDLSATYG